MKNFITRLVRFFIDLETRNLAPLVAKLRREVANLDTTERERLEAFDAEAKLHRDHFIARIQIDRINLKRTLAAKTHRLFILEKEHARND